MFFAFVVNTNERVYKHLINIYLRNRSWYQRDYIPMNKDNFWLFDPHEWKWFHSMMNIYVHKSWGIMFNQDKMYIKSLFLRRTLGRRILSWWRLTPCSWCAWCSPSTSTFVKNKRKVALGSSLQYFNLNW